MRLSYVGAITMAFYFVTATTDNAFAQRPKRGVCQSPCTSSVVCDVGHCAKNLPRKPGSVSQRVPGKWRQAPGEIPR
jgi:hypothetical protein